MVTWAVYCGKLPFIMAQIRRIKPQVKKFGFYFELEEGSKEEIKQKIIKRKYNTLKEIPKELLGEKTIYLLTVNKD